jgi:hypothetical protein
MASDFDISQTCRETIHALLRENTSLNGLNPQEINLDYRRRQSVVSAIVMALDDFESRHKVKATFWLCLRAEMLIDAAKTDSLFMGIANAICKNHVTNFHSMNSSERYVFSWDYNKYHIMAYSKKNHWKSFFMTVIDTYKMQDEEAESGNDTEDERKFIDSSKESLVCSLLQSLHDRINKLEAFYSNPTASLRRLE